eukprot:9534-Eustigmatos_ZCMA.PRE.1
MPARSLPEDCWRHIYGYVWDLCVREINDVYGRCCYGMYLNALLAYQENQNLVICDYGLGLAEDSRH